jgi:hypothetical protein
MKKKKNLLIVAIIGLACLVAVAIIMKWPQSIVSAMRHDTTAEPDKRVPWYAPPGKFDPSGDRIRIADINLIPGGLVDNANRALHFQGIALSQSPDWSLEGPLPAFAAWRQQGINLIRVPVRWQDIEPAPMQVSVDTVLGIRRFLDGAAAAGISVILENTTPWSINTACPGIPDAPLWAFRQAPEALRDGKCSTIKTVPGAATEVLPVSAGDIEAVKRFRLDLMDASWTPDNLALQDHLIRAWTKVGEVIAGSSSVIGYGITESLECPTDMTESKCTVAWTEFTDRFVNHVRAVDSPALFFTGMAPAAMSSTAGTATLIELVPPKALDFPVGLMVTLPSGVFAYRHIPVGPDSEWLQTISGIESRGRSFLVNYSDIEIQKKLLTNQEIPKRELLARPYPEAVAGHMISFGFDRLSMPDANDSAETKPAATKSASPVSGSASSGSPVSASSKTGRPGFTGVSDVFVLSFQDGEVRPREVPETTVYLPVNSLYRDDPASDAPRFTIDISDGSAGLMPGRTDAVLWHTVAGAGTHTMKIAPWGGSRLGGKTTGETSQNH